LIDGKPYISIYGLLNHPEFKRSKEKGKLFISYLKDYALNKYDLDLFLVGVSQHPGDLTLLKQAGFHHFTQYAGLPNFLPNSPPIQYYGEQLSEQKDFWLDAFNIFYPSATLGWNASIRGRDPVESSQEGLISAGYPYRPIIINDESRGWENFREYLISIWSYFLFNLSIEYPHILIFAWNEFGEDASLLPFVDEEGKTCWENMEMIGLFRKMLDNFPIPLP